ncbi:MAG: metal-dependent hydrolase family protein [Acidimicrobiia bacterium]
MDAAILIPGRGDPVPAGAVVIDGDTIAYAGPAAAAPALPPVGLHVPVVMPGMWDCHGHFLGVRRASLDDIAHDPVAVATARITADARLALNAGFTSVREPGGLGLFLGRVIDEGIIPGPHVYAAGAILSTTGGHGDLHSLPLRWVGDVCDEHRGLWHCDGVAECLKAVRVQLRMGARLIKVCTSGGVSSELDHPLHQQFSDEELSAIVEEAGRAERVVAAHCHGKAGIMAALRAGVRTIEHGSYLDEEAVAAMLETGAVLVPTRFVVERLLAMKGELPDYVDRKIRALADRHRESLELAVRSGVPIALGTDSFTSGVGSAVPWGRNGEELTHLVAAGLSPLAAIAAATADAPATLGPQAPRSGLLAEGYDADVIALAADPLGDVTVLADPANVTHVWKGGVEMKTPATALIG